MRNGNESAVHQCLWCSSLDDVASIAQIPHRHGKQGGMREHHWRRRQPDGCVLQLKGKCNWPQRNREKWLLFASWVYASLTWLLHELYSWLCQSNAHVTAVIWNKYWHPDLQNRSKLNLHAKHHRGRCSCWPTSPISFWNVNDLNCFRIDYYLNDYCKCFLDNSFAERRALDIDKGRPRYLWDHWIYSYSQENAHF